MTNREEGWQYDGSNEDLWVKEVDETGQITSVPFRSFQFLSSRQ